MFGISCCYMCEYYIHTYLPQLYIISVVFYTNNRYLDMQYYILTDTPIHLLLWVEGLRFTRTCLHSR